MKRYYATVALGLALDRQFDYAVPEDLGAEVREGVRVLVPFGPRLTTGYVTALSDSTAYTGKIKEIHALLDRTPTFTLHLLEFLKWTAAYYQVPLGHLMRKALPPSLHEAEKARVVLTTRGREECGEDKCPLLERLCEQRRVTLKRALEMVPRARIDRLEKEGLIEIRRTVESGGPGARIARMVRIAALDEEKLTGPRQIELARYVWASKVVDYKEISARFKNASALVRTLVERGVLEVEEVRSFRQVESEFEPPHIPDRLNVDQEAALKILRQDLAARSFAPHLLFGVTGSGKTEVYLRAIKTTLALRRAALVLVPEIALTPQLMAAFEARFPGQMAVLHSALSPGERLDQWCQVAQGSLPIVLGARSAIFAPLADIGLIIVDEEHEPSFKQDDTPYYNARDLAMVRGRMSGSTVILGSATPSLESFNNVAEGKFTCLRLPRRATPKPLPDVLLVDLRRAGFADNDKVFSKPLAAAMEKNLADGHQTILFLNRKGFAAFLLCEACGAVPRCPHCDISLTLYRQASRLRCHYCQYARSIPDSCPTCSTQGVLKQVGYGTERVADSLATFIPHARVARLDSTVSGGGRLTATLRAFRNREIDILVGTQIVAKGHDFPAVTLVGVLLADLGLAFPDLRAAERTFQLLTQVAGRAGRGKLPGTVFVQTYLPQHYSLTHAQRQDYDGFAAEELDHRRMRRFPPFFCLSLLRVSGTDLEETRTSAGNARLGLEMAARGIPDVEITGPGMAPLSYVRDRYRMQILVKTPGRPAMQALMKRAGAELDRRLPRRGRIRWSIDVDPMNLM